MFTGIVQGVAVVTQIRDEPGLRSFTLIFPPGFSRELALGASVAVDGVCLTVTDLKEADVAAFDVMSQSLSLTTLGGLKEGDRVNVERSAHEGAEIGGHPLSGHVDFAATVSQIHLPRNNRSLRFSAPAPWMRYLFVRGYIAINGASLTLSQVHREPDGSGWFDVWLIPETLRMTTFEQKEVGARVNVEIDRQTQVFVDTLRDAVAQQLENLLGERDMALQRNAARMTPRLRHKRQSTLLSNGGLGEMAKRKKGTIKPHTDDGIGPSALRARTDDGIGPSTKRKAKGKAKKKAKKKAKAKKKK
jgi:riboflavin synthase